MSNALALVPADAQAVVITNEQIALIRQTVAKGATDAELQLFFYDCTRRGVHPLDKLIHFTKRGGKYTPITSIDFMRGRAAESGEYAGNDDPLFVGKPKTEDYAATVSVYRLVQGQRCQFTATARWPEYKPNENDFMWQRMPHTMLGKCAEALALRKAFPQQLAGLYAKEEMDQAATAQPPTVVGVVDTATGEVTEEAAIHLEPDQYYVQDVSVLRKGEKDERPWTLFGVTVHTGAIFQTFETDIADAARSALKDARAVEIHTEKAKKGGGTKISGLSPLFKDAEEKVL